MKHVPFDVQVFDGYSVLVSVDPDADINIFVTDEFSDSYSFTIEQMETFIEQAKEHKTAYSAYVEDDYNPDTYFKVMERFNKRKQNKACN
jgi:hypothetical protein